MSARLKEQYNKKIRPELMKELGLDNVMAVPRIKKIVLNSGVGEATTNKQAIDEVVENFVLIAGQKPVVTKARTAISTFKIRQGLEIGVKATLRGDRMWFFLDKLISVVFPRTRDFRGLPTTAFDKVGNYSIGISEHTVFPEIDPNKVQKIRGLQIIIVIDAKDPKHSKALLDKFGLPFVRDGNQS